MTPDRQAPPAVRWTALQGGSWEDGGCWDAGRAPLPDERACFDRPVAGAVNIHDRVAVARVEVDLGDTRAAVVLGGPGVLVLTGADRFLGKPVALQVAHGRLRLAPPLRVEVAATRFGVHAGGRLIVTTPHVRAVADDLKLAVSQTGVLELRAERWEPGFDLDVATSRTLGLGPHIISYRRDQFGYGGGGRDPVSRLLAFRSFKEHDGDELLILGFLPGDQLRFEEDPRKSTDPGKELRLHAVRFPDAAHDGAARVKRSGRFYYLLPEDRRYTVPAPDATGRPMSRPTTAVLTARPVPIAKAARAGDAVSLSGGRLLAAVSSKDRTLSVAVSSGKGWSRPATLALPAGAIGATAPSLLCLASGAILLVYQALLPARPPRRWRWRNAPSRPAPGAANAWSPPRMVSGLEPRLRLANGRLAQGGDALLLPFTLGSEVGLLTSTDDGSTWRRHGPLVPGPGSGLRYPAVAEPDPGRLLLLAATATHRIYRSEMHLGDDGWTTPTEVTTLVAPEAPARPDPAGAGRRPDGRLEPP